MRAVVFDGTKAHFTTDYPEPVPIDGESLIKIELSAICSTDREMLRGYRPDFKAVMGHEFVGIVKASNDASLVGQRVVGEINLNCDRCLYCLTGRPHHCSERTTLGINNKNGSFADYITLPTHLLWPVDDSLEPERAVFTEPLAASLRITEQVFFSTQVTVAIVGDGRLALMICQALAAKTAVDLQVFGKHPEKLELFKPYAKVACEPEGSYEIVIDATGSPTSLKTSISLTRSEGILVIKSTYAGNAEIDMSEIVVREITIKGSRCGPFQPALELLRDHRVKLPELELHDPADFQAAFDSKAFKAALDFRS
jgi:threonine dehydrogenase-like Zn-dependent dehydrogenase